MKQTLEERFNRYQKKNPTWSSYLCFTKAISNHHYSQIRKQFNKLVTKDDYDLSKKGQLVEFLSNLNLGK